MYITNSLLTEFDQELHDRCTMEYGYEQGVADGEARGAEQNAIANARNHKSILGFVDSLLSPRLLRGISFTYKTALPAVVWKRLLMSAGIYRAIVAGAIHRGLAQYSRHLL